MRRLRPRPSRAPRTARDEGMAMMVVVCCFMLAAGLSVGLLGVLFSELTPTTYEREAARTITGSQAGLQVGLCRERGCNRNKLSSLLGDLRGLCGGR